MKVIQVSTEQLRRQLSELLNQVSYGGAQIVVERYGKPVAVLLPYPPRTADTEMVEEVFGPAEQVPQLARQIEKAVKEAGINYESFAEGLQAERLRTLREKYPDFADKYAPGEAA